MPGEQSSCAICSEQFEARLDHCPHDGAPLGSARRFLETDSLLGQIVLGGFRLLKLIGYGRMGRVYLAKHERSEQPAAIKILHRELVGDAKLVHRFKREAQIALVLDHPHIVKLYGHGLIADPESGAPMLPALLMEHLSGVSLRSVLVRHPGPLPLERALELCRQLCHAVGLAHRRGIVHRDIKPANIMLLDTDTGRDFAKVLDFGIAKSTQQQGSRPTTRGSVLGTPAYISPEAALGEAISPASDVYSMAALLFECLTGAPPFNDPNPITVLMRHTSERPPRLDEHAAGQRVPSVIVDLVDRNLAKRAAERDPNAQAFLERLEQAARQCGLSH